MATLNTLFKIEELQTTDPTPDFDDESAAIHFINLNKNGRSLLLRVYGTLGSNVLCGHYGDSVFFKPNDDELENLLKIEDRLANETVFPDDYEFQPTLNKDYQLNLKLKSKNDKFVFSGPFTLDSAESELTRGRQVCIEIAPGFYFSKDKKKESLTCGVYYTLKSLKPVEEPKKKADKSTQTKRTGRQ